MATKKSAAKPVKKVAPAKKAVKPVKKSVPAKKSAKPAPKAVKPAPKKPVAKKVIPAKKATPKPVAKKVVPVKKAAPVSAPKKAIVKKAEPAKKVVIKPVAKKAAPAPIKKVPVKKVTPAPVKAVEIKKVIPAVKEVSKKTEPVKAVPIKQIIKPNPIIKANVKNPKDIKIPTAKPVVLPKINTKTSRTYQPDFTKSVLDKYKNDPGAPMARYSDSELVEFRELILRKVESAKKELNYLQGLITRKDDTGGDESENRYMTMEDGSLSMEREQLSQMASRQITFIDHLEKAMMRIENKTYGICRVTGKLIDKARLRAVPHATLSIEAKMGIVK